MKIIKNNRLETNKSYKKYNRNKKIKRKIYKNINNKQNNNNNQLNNRILETKKIKLNHQNY